MKNTVPTREGFPAVVKGTPVSLDLFSDYGNPIYGTVIVSCPEGVRIRHDNGREKSYPLRDIYFLSVGGNPKWGG